jgi:DNA modification methylase
MSVLVITGDCREVLRTLPESSVHCVVTSPPYFGLRDYGVEGQIGLEQTPDEYVAKLVDVFREVRRVLRDDGTLWLNLGDSYAGGNSTGKWREGSARADGKVRGDGATSRRNRNGIGAVSGCKPKDLIGIPWRVAFALQADGWYLRQDIIWNKPNPMPESVRDRCTKAHEYIFLLSKSERYYFDSEAVKEEALHPTVRHKSTRKTKAQEAAFLGNAPTNLGRCGTAEDGMRNRRSVWTVATEPFKGAHFAVFPPSLIEPCILAGCPKGGTVLDPFGGSGTTGLVADRLGRNAVLIELNPEYAEMARRRVLRDGGMFADIELSAQPNAAL